MFYSTCDYCRSSKRLVLLCRYLLVSSNVKCLHMGCIEQEYNLVCRWRVALKIHKLCWKSANDNYVYNIIDLSRTFWLFCISLNIETFIFKEGNTVFDLAAGEDRFNLCKLLFQKTTVDPSRLYKVWYILHVLP